GLYHSIDRIAHDYPIWVAQGGEIIPMLQKILLMKRHPLKPLASQLLYDIQRETKYRLGQSPDYHYCLTCLYLCDARTISRSSSLVYYGCRLCGQSRNIFTGKLIAILDNETILEQRREGQTLWVNWLIDRRLFDFSAVRIEQATDEEVERFIVQIGNDTDAKRQKRYAQIECRVSADCELSENSHRLLQKTFGEVVFE
ncbi:MAG: hypothetical protein AAF485_21920, partial [Chloroflexota bacterium]